MVLSKKMLYNSFTYDEKRVAFSVYQCLANRPRLHSVSVLLTGATYSLVLVYPSRKDAMVEEPPKEPLQDREGEAREGGDPNSRHDHELVTVHKKPSLNPVNPLSPILEENSQEVRRPQPGLNTLLQGLRRGCTGGVRLKNLFKTDPLNWNQMKRKRWAVTLMGIQLRGH